MSARTLAGLLVPVITPFDLETGEVAPVPLRDHARRMLAAGAAGIVAGGSTGEMALLDEAEFTRVLEWLRGVVPEDRWLVAGVGRESTRATIAACRAAQAAGADLALVRPPAYYGPSLDVAGLVDHFRQVADASPIPLLLYNIPKYTHVMLHDAVLTQLAAHGNVRGAKDSSGDLKNFADWRAAVPAWALFIGSGSLALPALELGGAGGVLGIANVVPELVMELFSRWRAGDREGASAIQARLAPLNTLVVAQLGVPGVKAAIELAGGYASPLRSPLRALSPGLRQQIVDALTASTQP
ncbi:MAG: dihydrodipicolinate synthase family protein [Gemmatimonadales bacterium]